MRTLILLSTLSIVLNAQNITLEPIELEETSPAEAGSYILSSEEAKETHSISLLDRLQEDVSLTLVTDNKGEAAISLHGLSHKATGYIHDGIPLYRTGHGFIDTGLIMHQADVSLNDGSTPSPLGVSSMGGDVLIHSPTPLKELESSMSTSFSSNDEYLHGYLGSRTGDLYVQADADYYHRSNYTLSEDYRPTPLQGAGKRINSDRTQKNASFKSGIYLDDALHLAAKLSLARLDYGLVPNVHTDPSNPVWDAYSRIDKKESDSLYLYGDYTNKEIEVNARVYYDEYQDIWTIYNDVSYQSHWPAVLYDDSRLGANLKTTLKGTSTTNALFLQTERNKHIRRGGAMETTQSQTDTFKGSYLHHWDINDFWKLDDSVSYTLIQANETADQSALNPIEDKKALDAQIRLAYEDDTNTYYTSVAKKSRMPEMGAIVTFFPWEVANPGLKPEQSMQYTAGYQHTLETSSIFKLSFYYYDVKDLLLFVNGNEYINRKKAEHYGTDIRFESEMLERHYLRLSYAYTHAYDSEDQALELIPRHRLKLEDTIRISQGYKAYVSYEYTGSRFSGNTATYTNEQEKLSAYHLLDLQISYEVSEQFDIRGGLKNLLDEDYEWRYGYPAEGRSLYLGLNIAL